MLNSNLLKGKIYEKGLTLEKMAELIGMNSGTLSSKLNLKRDFTVKQADKIVKILNLTPDETMNIFFNQFVA